MKVKKVLLRAQGFLLRFFKRMGEAWAEAGDIQQRINESKAEHYRHCANRMGHLR